MKKVKPKLPAKKTQGKISKTVQQEILFESGYKCGNPACQQILTLELNQAARVRDGGGNKSSNLLALCPNCHSSYTHGYILKSAIRHWKGMLLSLNHAFNKESKDLLLLLHHTKTRTIWVLGDGIFRFAGLFSAGLVKFTNWYATTTTSGHHSGCQVALTETGEQFVEAWIARDEKKYQTLLTETNNKP